MAETSQESRREDEKKARALHLTLELIGLRAQATAVGFLQLCSELRRSGAIDDAAVDRIKQAIATDIIVSRTAPRGREEFERSLRKRLDVMFEKAGDGDGPGVVVGSHEDMPAEFNDAHENAGLREAG